MDSAARESRRQSLELIPSVSGLPSSRPDVGTTAGTSPWQIHPVQIAASSNDKLTQALHPSSSGDPSAAAAAILRTNSPGALDAAKVLRAAVELENARQFVVSMCTDLDGNIWVGTEGDGVQRFNPHAAALQQWRRYTTRDGLGDDYAYAIACDQQGRIWVGHLNHGVSVFNGVNWRNYDVSAGPLGERVFRVAVCPGDGSVWIATDCGLSRYDPSTDQWNNYTRASGLPSDQISGLAFDKTGNIYAATQCDGLAIASLHESNLRWRHISGPDDLSPQPTGAGLPTNQINDVLAANDGTVFAATSAGLAWSIDRGNSWRFVRGADWADKVRNSAFGPPPGWRARPGAFLAEDFITCLSEEAQGAIYVGYRQHGWEKFARGTAGSLISLTSQSKGIVSALPVRMENLAVAGTYGKGLISLGAPSANLAPAETPTTRPVAKWPAGATPPSLYVLNQELDAAARVSPNESMQPPWAIALPDDWRTQGDWLGRYGRYWAVIPTIDAYADYVWGAGEESVPFVRQIGPHHNSGDGLRRWITALYSDDPRCLQMPPVYMDSRVKHGLTTPRLNRRPAQWDDHGEAYSSTYEGPDLYCTLKIPAGEFILSIYELNDNAHSVPNRDFKLEIRPHSENGLDDLSNFDTQPILAESRVAMFYGGVYKRFVVCGPAGLTVKASRQYSFNADLIGMMLDRLDEQTPPYFMLLDQWQSRQSERARLLAEELAEWKRDPNLRLARFAPAASEFQAGQILARLLDEMRDWNPAWWAANHQRLAVLLSRWCEAHAMSAATKSIAGFPALLADSYYQAGWYEKWESALKSSGIKTPRDIESALRWDGVSGGYSGHGYRTVTAYLESLSGK